MERSSSSKAAAMADDDGQRDVIDSLGFGPKVSEAADCATSELSPQPVCGALGAPAAVSLAG